MPVARLSFPSYQSSNENGGGGHAWLNIQGAGATAEGAGAYSIRDPNSADMNWIRSYGDGARGGADIPAGSIITGIVVGFQAHCTGGNQTGGTYDVSIFKNSSAVASKSGSIANEGSIGGFGASNDLWGLGALATPAYFSTGIYFGLHLNFPNITANITLFAWNGYMDIYYNDPVPIASSITVGGGDGQSAQVSTQYGLQLYAIVRDQGGNPMPGKSVTFTMPGSGASAGFNSVGGPLTATAITNASGGAVSPFFFANATAGGFQPVADVTGSSPLIYTMFSMTNTPAPVIKVPTTMALQQGNSQQAAVSTAFSTLLKVRVFDQFVQPMPNVDITWAPPGSGVSGIFQGGNPVRNFTDSGGVATAPVLFANANAGNWSLPVTCTGFAVTQSFALTNLANNSPPTPTSGEVVSGSNQSAALNAQFPNPIQVKVLDQYGSPYNGATVVATIPSAAFGSWTTGGTVKSVVSGANGFNDGIARFGQFLASGTVQTNWSISVVGNAFVGGVDTFAAAVTVTGINNVDATIVTALASVSGNNQIATPNTAFGQALVARATNALGAGVQNYAVLFTAPGSAQSCTFAGSSTQTINTDANGYATSSVPVANVNEGSYNVTATGAGGKSCVFPLQNGQTYSATICTAFENGPGPNSNQSLGSAGGTGGTTWTNLGNASQPAQGGNSSQNGQDPPNSNRSAGLYIDGPPASWLAIPNDAKIISVSINYSAMVATVSTQVGAGSMYTGFAKEGLTAITFGPDNLVVDVWKNVSRTYTIPAGNPMTGAQLKNNSRFYINFNPASNFGTSQQCRVNGVQVQVCYQTVIPPPQREQYPLMLCEA
jgi:hypothetical protein